MDRLQSETVKCQLTSAKQSIVWRFNPSVFSFGTTRTTAVQYPLDGDAAYITQTGLVRTVSIPLEYPDFSTEIEASLKVVEDWVKSGEILKLSYGQHQYSHVVLKGYSASITRYEAGSARSGSISLDLVITSEKSANPVFSKQETKKPLVKTPREIAKEVLKNS